MEIWRWQIPVHKRKMRNLQENTSSTDCNTRRLGMLVGASDSSRRPLADVAGTDTAAISKDPHDLTAYNLRDSIHFAISILFSALVIYLVPNRLYAICVIAVSACFMRRLLNAVISTTILRSWVVTCPGLYYVSRIWYLYRSFYPIFAATCVALWVILFLYLYMFFKFEGPVTYESAIKRK